MLGTFLIMIRRPSVEPMPIEANDLTDDASENIRVEPLSLKMYEPDLTRCANCGAFIMLGLEKASEGSPEGETFDEILAVKFICKTHQASEISCCDDCGGFLT